MLKFLLVTFLIISLIRMVAPFLLRWLVAFLFKKHVRKGGFGTQQQPFGQSQQQRYQKPAGHVRVDYIPDEQQKSRKEFNGGEYVDYEEIK